MLYTLKERKELDPEIKEIIDKIEIPEYFKNIHKLLNLRYINDNSDLILDCDLDLNEKVPTYEICFVSCDNIFGHIVKKYKTIDFVKVCYMIKFIKELVESADHYGENETKNEVLYKECINTIRQYFNNGGKLDEFDGYFDEL